MEVRLGDGFKAVSLSVLVNGADGVDGAGGACGVCRGNDFAICTSDCGANLSGDVLRKRSDNGVSAVGTVGGRDGSDGAARGSLISGCDGDGDGLSLPFDNFLASAAGGHSSSGDERREREGSSGDRKLHGEQKGCFQQQTKE
jgi:hypothetical protein